jgi:hypothetical protein
MRKGSSAPGKLSLRETFAREAQNQGALESKAISMNQGKHDRTSNPSIETSMIESVCCMQRIKLCVH